MSEKTLDELLDELYTAEADINFERYDRYDKAKMAVEKWKLTNNKQEGISMKIEKPSQVLAFIAWGSLFVEIWLMLIGIIPADGLRWSFFVFFLVISVIASAVSSYKKP